MCECVSEVRKGRDQDNKKRTVRETGEMDVYLSAYSVDHHAMHAYPLLSSDRPIDIIYSMHRTELGVVDRVKVLCGCVRQETIGLPESLNCL